MKKFLTIVLSALLLVGCFALVAVAAEETTVAGEETTEGEAPSYSNTLLVFNDDAKAMRVIDSVNGINKSLYDSEWEGARLEITEVEDPYINISWSTYIKKAGLEQVDSQAYPFVAFKLKVEGYVEDMEMFYCAGNVTGPVADLVTTADYPCECSGRIECVIFNLTDICQGNYNLFRIDPMYAEEDTVIYLYELALFATEEEALAYAALNHEETETTVHETVAPRPETEPETEADVWETVEVVTEYPVTIPEVNVQPDVIPEIEDPDDLLGDIMDIPFDGLQGLLPTMLGCNSSISVSVGALLSMIALCALCFRKKD